MRATCPLPHRLTGAFDVVIVGGGFAGLWTALALKSRRPDLSVTLIEASICGPGASGKNGGKVHGYWSSLETSVQALGPDGTLAIAKQATGLKTASVIFAAECGRDIWWREGGNLVVATTPAQEEKIEAIVRLARELGAQDHVMAALHRGGSRSLHLADIPSGASSILMRRRSTLPA